MLGVREVVSKERAGSVGWGALGSAPACHLSPHLPAEILLASASVEGDLKLSAECLKDSMDIQLFRLLSASVPKSSLFGAGSSKVYLLTNCPPRPAAQWDAHVGLARGGPGLLFVAAADRGKRPDRPAQ